MNVIGLKEEQQMTTYENWIKNMKITPLSMVDKRGLQRCVISCTTSNAMHVRLHVWKDDEKMVDNYLFALNGGETEAVVFVPVQEQECETRWQITDKNGNILSEEKVLLKKPRQLTVYVTTSSHTDIGLHNSQYIQKYYSSEFTDDARVLCDETAERPEENQYRYVMEGTWFFENYVADRSEQKSKELIENYIKQGKMGVCCGIAGNHTQMYGLEELCMSTYEKSKLEEQYGISSKTMTMIDNNGMSMSIIGPYADAGIENIIFAPNQWNPLPSTVYKMNHRATNYTWNPMAQGGGARIDIRYTSNLPMLFFWKEEHSDKKLLVWGSTQYGLGGDFWGMNEWKDPYDWNWHRTSEMEDTMSINLPIFEEKYPYDIWMFEAYDDDMKPNLFLADTIRDWNAKWEWPKFRMTGNPDEPFDLIREKYSDIIPVLTGDITGGWYQHPLTTPELVAKKFELDRLLPVAEKMATLAGLVNPDYTYPVTDFRRAWDYLLFHDEHSYGVSGYQGKRVYETWMQHNDWLNKVKKISEDEISSALAELASHISAEEDSTVVFNPASSKRTEWISDGNGNYALAEIPAMGYTVIPQKDFKAFVYADDTNTGNDKPCCAPVVENKFYRLTFSANGSICSIYDKELGSELLNENASYAANELVYTKDNHKNFMVPEDAEFTVQTSKERTVVTAVNKNSIAGADIIRTVTLDNITKRIDIDNELKHARDFYNKRRYQRYLYFSFPFAVKNARRLCHLNGSMAEYGKTITGHGTDVYMAANEWCCVENGDIGVALIAPDTTLVEFDHIHVDKTDFGDVGDGSEIYVYAANDWLQMHAYGGDYFNFRFRYSIVSYIGNSKNAEIPRIAEQICTPVQSVNISAQKGRFHESSHSLIEMDTSMRLIGLKRAKDGNGVIARLYGAWDDPAINSELLSCAEMTVLTPNEQKDYKPVSSEHGFYTCKLGKDSVYLKVREPKEQESDEVGTVHTGLITGPVAASGEDADLLYLLWGHAAAEDITHYRLYRGETEDFICDETTFVADVDPGKYRVISYEDRGLGKYRRYYYRVCAVHADGHCGKLSEVFSGITKEILE